MTDNLAVLERNMLAGIETDAARTAFMWALEFSDPYQAERFAWEVDQLVGFLAPHLLLAAGLHAAPEAVLDDVTHFILQRHANYRFGGNKRLPWTGKATAAKAA